MSEAAAAPVTDLMIRKEQGNRLEAAQLKYIATTDFVPKSMRGNVPAIMACIATGRELGLGDMESLRSINVIDGRPSLSGELMVKLARDAGHSIEFDVGEGKATAVGIRGDNGNKMTVTWTTAMAQRAGLLNKDNWKKYPETMLTWRAASQLCRFNFPDVFSGLSHTPEEMEMSPEERIEEKLAAATPPSDTGPDDTPPPATPARAEEVEDAELVEAPAPEVKVEEVEDAAPSEAEVAAVEEAPVAPPQDAAPEPAADAEPAAEAVEEDEQGSFFEDTLARSQAVRDAREAAAE